MAREVSRKSKYIAYMLWLLGFVGVCGLHRLYVGKVGSGLLYLFTFGFFGIGQLVDLFLTSDMIDYWNCSLATSLPHLANQLPSLQQRILEVCRNGEVSIGQICLGVSSEVSSVKEELHKLEAEGVLLVSIDRDGIIRYRLS